VKLGWNKWNMRVNCSQGGSNSILLIFKILGGGYLCARCIRKIRVSTTFIQRNAPNLLFNVHRFTTKELQSNCEICKFVEKWTIRAVQFSIKQFVNQIYVFDRQYSGSFCTHLGKVSVLGCEIWCRILLRFVVVANCSVLVGNQLVGRCEFVFLVMVRLDLW
jgi:hypothetical protein